MCGFLKIPPSHTPFHLWEICNSIADQAKGALLMNLIVSAPGNLQAEGQVQLHTSWLSWISAVTSCTAASVPSWQNAQHLNSLHLDLWGIGQKQLKWWKLRANCRLECQDSGKTTERLWGRNATGNTLWGGYVGVQQLKPLKTDKAEQVLQQPSQGCGTLPLCAWVHSASSNVRLCRMLACCF